ncbi:MAG: amidohydrolase [Clostridium sp.]
MKKIFYNGTIITMEEELYAPAVLTSEGIIEKVGSFEELCAAAPDAERIDLGEKTMMPAFIDAHSHFSSYANAQLQVALDETASFDDISEKITAFIHSHHLEAGTWIVAKGYDHNTLLEKCHPDKDWLDQIAPQNPLILQHQSGHCGVLNTKALELLGITADTPSPPGGVIGQKDGKLTGYMEEDAYIGCIKNVPISGMEEMLGAYKKAQENYLSYGITTVQEGMMVAQMLPLYQSLMESGLLTVDVVGYSDMSSMKTLASAFKKSLNQYDKHFKIGGYKIFLDGSPQVKTAWMTTPYQGSDDNFGYGTMRDEDVIAAVRQSAAEQVQILAHCNGDAAIWQYINAVKTVAAEDAMITTLRPVIIHAQMMTGEQLEEAAKLHMIPSFFVAHVLHWGDVHIRNFGYERARTISPANTALKNHIMFTFHQDAPVIEPNMLETIQCAVTRKTKTGVQLDENECIDVLDALRAVTVHAAYQYREEKEKGSIKEGKHADFVILSDNPLTVPKEEIANVIVVETIKDGKTVFLKDSTQQLF